MEEDYDYWNIPIITPMTELVHYYVPPTTTYEIDYAPLS